jgi:hypothetical protein
MVNPHRYHNIWCLTLKWKKGKSLVLSSSRQHYEYPKFADLWHCYDCKVTYYIDWIAEEYNETTDLSERELETIEKYKFTSTKQT